MSWQPCPDPILGDAHAADLVEAVIIPRARDLGGFEVRRALPSPKRQMVGPFIFFDQMGPAEFMVGKGTSMRTTFYAKHLPLSREMAKNLQSFGEE